MSIHRLKKSKKNSLKLDLRTLQIIIVFSLLSLFLIKLAITAKAQQGQTLVTYTGCLQNVRGTLDDLATGTSPLNTCRTGESQVTWSNGDIISVRTEGGLTGGAESGDATVSIADQGVTTSKIADGAVTSEKMTPTILMNTNEGYISTTSTSLVDVTNASTNLTVPTGKTFDTIVTISGIGSMNGNVDYYIIAIDRDGNNIKTWGIGTNGFDVATPFSFTIKDTGLTAGSHTYKVRVANISTNLTTTIQKTYIVVQAFNSQ